MFRKDGKVDYVAAKRGAVRLGRGVAVDPRGGPAAPVDQQQAAWNQYTIPIYPYPSNNRSRRQVITY